MRLCRDLGITNREIDELRRRNPEIYSNIVNAWRTQGRESVVEIFHNYRDNVESQERHEERDNLGLPEIRTYQLGVVAHPGDDHRIIIRTIGHNRILDIRLVRNGGAEYGGENIDEQTRELLIRRLRDANTAGDSGN